jgi:type I restriction enzyme, S subunit
MGEFPSVELAQLIDPDRSISYGIVQPGSPCADGVPIIRVSDVRNGQISTTKPLRVLHDIEAQYSRTRLSGGELLITVVGTVGETAIVPQSLAGWNVARAIAVLPVRSDVGAYWVQLALQSPLVRSRIDSRLNTTVQATLNLGDVGKLPILLPPKPEREGIEALVGALDRKIELNRRMNETLEAMARAIFKDWFVDFGPTVSKMEGRVPYLASEIWAMFPSRLAGDGKPEGWRTELLIDHARIVSGGTPKTEEPAYWGGEIAWASAKDVSQCSDAFLITTDRRITERGLNESTTRIIPKLATVVVARGATTGRFCMFGRDMAMNQTCYALAPSHGRPFWLNCAFGSLVEAIVHAAHGSVFDTITTNTIKGVRVTLANPALLDHFEATVEPLFSRLLANIEQSDTLAATRDLLFPKLMSGEIRVKEAEKEVQAVA